MVPILNQKPIAYLTLSQTTRASDRIEGSAERLPVFTSIQYGSYLDKGLARQPALVLPHQILPNLLTPSELQISVPLSRMHQA